MSKLLLYMLLLCMSTLSWVFVEQTVSKKAGMQTLVCSLCWKRTLSGIGKLSKIILQMHGGVRLSSHGALQMCTIDKSLKTR
ncbi:hypothetical protein FRX31_025564 [Thalictrum thalictroides]|uniref:Transmembrane protein n=1 Tax=Thalictrum thalictroides TaxID=46969 RepID=A0A7J6VKJ0_THATH|nr:hypothetical protein FRX31_025564 [Thalictrum thalictroides]